MELTLNELLPSRKTMTVTVTCAPGQDSVCPAAVDECFNVNVIREVEFIRVQVLHDGASRSTSGLEDDYENEPGHQTRPNIAGSIDGKEFLIPVNSMRKINFANTSKVVYSSVAEVIEDRPRFVKAESEVRYQTVGPRGREDKVIEQNTQLELKWVHTAKVGDKVLRYLKCTSEKQVYTLEETLMVNMSPVPDKKEYTLSEISRFALLPANIQFVEQPDTYVDMDSKPSTRENILSNKLRLLRFEVLDIRVSVIDNTGDSSHIFGILPDSFCESVRLTVQDSADENYSNVSASSTLVDTHVRQSFYVLEAEHKDILWFDEDMKEQEPVGLHFSTKLKEKPNQECACSKMVDNNICTTGDLSSIGPEVAIAVEDCDLAREYEDIVFETARNQAETTGAGVPLCGQANMVDETVSSVNSEKVIASPEKDSQDYQDFGSYENVSDTFDSEHNRETDASFYEDIDKDDAATNTWLSPLMLGAKIDDIRIVESFSSEKSPQKDKTQKKQKDTNNVFFEYSLKEVQECLSMCSLGDFAMECLNQNLDGKFFEDIDFSVFKSEPFNLSHFQMLKLDQIINKGWRPKK